MGQATADLPDPLAASANGSNSTDDLLAQLAGEEIERLLAETETTPETPSSQLPEPPAAVIASPQPPTIIAAPAAAPATASKVVPPEAPPTAAPAEDLESIFTQLDELDKAAASVLPKPVDTPKPASEASPEEPSVAEALAAEMAEDAAQHAKPLMSVAAMKAEAHAASDSDAVEKKPAFFVTLLAMLSSPLDAFSDETRDLIGKIAILTMLNALCVLAYVVFFRR